MDIIQSCWQCEHPSDQSLFCKFCNSLQRPAQDYYSFFDMEKRLNLDTSELQRRFYSLSRMLHPDKYQSRPAREREYSLQATAILNDGYRVLRDPVKRAEYVLREHGFEAAEQRSKDVPPELLEEVFDLNMALEELRSGERSGLPQLEEARSKFNGLLEETDADLKELFEEWDREQKRETLASVRKALNRRKYLENLVNEVEKELRAGE
jgi:molecular chaperone HscB